MGEPFTDRFVLQQSLKGRTDILNDMYLPSRWQASTPHPTWGSLLVSSSGTGPVPWDRRDRTAKGTAKSWDVCLTPSNGKDRRASLTPFSRRNHGRFDDVLCFFISSSFKQECFRCCAFLVTHAMNHCETMDGETWVQILSHLESPGNPAIFFLSLIYLTGLLWAYSVKGKPFSSLS